MDQERLHRRAREQGANPLVYWLIRAVFQPFFHLYFRLGRSGREHIPAEGPVIIASNHRSFLDPFVIGTMARRPMYYVAKREMFTRRWRSWILSALGAFPVQRGTGDTAMIETAMAILERGDILLMFPEGTRTRPGPLGKPRRGAARLALETGAVVVPVAVIGTEAVRRGWRIRPRKVRIRAGLPLRFPRVESPSPALAGAVTKRIWPCVMLQWEWLGGTPPIRRAAIIGAGPWGTSLAISLGRAGIEVDLGCRNHEQAQALASSRENRQYLPGVRLPDSVRVMRAAELVLDGQDVVCLAVGAGWLPSVLDAQGGGISGRIGVLVASHGLVAPLGTLPSSFVAERCHVRGIAVLGGPAEPAHIVEPGGSVVLASLDLGLTRQLADAFRAAKLDVSLTDDMIGVDLAGCAQDAAVLAAAVASATDPDIAGPVAAKVWAEVAALARLRGARPETFAGLALTEDLAAAVAGPDSRNRDAGELLAQGMSAAEISCALGQGPEAMDSVARLASLVNDAGLQAPALQGLAALAEGRIGSERWVAEVTEPAQRNRLRSIRVA
jgi:glycerol-3-phosphate dehydrogenase (NAD(P)+)